MRKRNWRSILEGAPPGRGTRRDATVPAWPSAGAGVRACAQERGAVLVHVAVAMAGLLAFSALTVDLGLLWVARTEAQSAADAAALAGASALAYTPNATTDHALAAASAVSSAHTVLGDAPTTAGLDTSVSPCPAGVPTVGECVHVRLNRGTGGEPALPAYFSRLFGISTQKVAASGVAQVLRANTVPCPRPWAIADRWLDAVDTPNDGTWTTDDLFERYQPTEPWGVLQPGIVDRYDRPTADFIGTGHTVRHMLGHRVVLGRGNAVDPVVRGDVFFSLDLPRSGESPGGEAQYAMNVTSCSGVPLSIGDVVFSMGTDDSVIRTAVDTLVATDPGATWDGTAITGSAFGTSPRVVPIALYDPDALARQGNPPSERFALEVRNLVGFFVEQYSASGLTGVFVPMPGSHLSDRETLIVGSSFLRTVALVR